jgi:hypothetical protein
MRLRLLTVVGALALTLAAPSAALAHHGRRHHRRHHDARAHAQFRFEHIGPSGVSAPSATPSAPSAPTPSTTPENAGKVLSYEKEVLTITLNDGSTVSGKVTSDTRIECVSATPTTTEPPDRGPGDDNGAGNDQNRGDTSQSDEGWEGHKDEGGEGWSDREQGGDDSDDGGEPPASPEPPCDTSLLAKERVVRSAELRIGPSGEGWENLVLVR